MRYKENPVLKMHIIMFRPRFTSKCRPNRTITSRKGSSIEDLVLLTILCYTFFNLIEVRILRIIYSLKHLNLSKSGFGNINFGYKLLITMMFIFFQI